MFFILMVKDRKAKERTLPLGAYYMFLCCHSLLIYLLDSIALTSLL